MSTDVRETVEKCNECQENCPNQPQDEPGKLPMPTQPMMSCSTNLAKHCGTQHLILVDCFSGMICCEPLKRETSDAVIRMLNKIFIRNGFPQWLHLNGGPCYDSYEFSTYAEAHHIRLVRSSPGHPKSNGLAEASIKSAKSILDR